ncbi:CYTH domain-containing protein [Caballeronia sp. Lep1P3]|uniref:CYTH domain-containing protein n=1 Tax=Caballeronia sp. Lep1P3 TaxID=2878150 RepID=UPI001FD05DD8|nr:CYTH domain-containing protein [Caballeronia sp. Lep1P3]
MEKELKLQVTAGKASQIMHAPAVSRLLNGSAESNDLVSTYFDTPEMHLRKNGASLRVRAVGEQRLQTLKLEGTITAGLFERDEFECPVNGDRPDLGTLLTLIPKDSKAIDILAERDLAERLEPLFLTRINRCAATLQLPDGTELELAMDDGAVEATARASAPIHGVELELKNGDPEQLYTLALAPVTRRTASDRPSQQSGPWLWPARARAKRRRESRAARTEEARYRRSSLSGNREELSRSGPRQRARRGLRTRPFERASDARRASPPALGARPVRTGHRGAG